MWTGGVGTSVSAVRNASLTYLTSALHATSPHLASPHLTSALQFARWRTINADLAASATHPVAREAGPPDLDRGALERLARPRGGCGCGGGGGADDGSEYDTEGDLAAAADPALRVAGVVLEIRRIRADLKLGVTLR